MAGGQGKRVRTVVQTRCHDLRAVLWHAEEASSESEVPGSVRESKAWRGSDLRAKSEYPLRTRVTGRHNANPEHTVSRAGMFNEEKAEMVTDEATQGRSKQSRQRLFGLEGMGRSSGRSRSHTKQEIKRTDFMIGMTRKLGKLGGGRIGEERRQRVVDLVLEQDRRPARQDRVASTIVKKQASNGIDGSGRVRPRGRSVGSHRQQGADHSTATVPSTYIDL